MNRCLSCCKKCDGGERGGGRLGRRGEGGAGLGGAEGGFLWREFFGQFFCVYV